MIRDFFNGLFHGCDPGECGWTDEEYYDMTDCHEAGSPPPSSFMCAICGLMPCIHPAE